ncbi:AAA family ATPase [Streptomyces sp. SAJ15]|uniref:AAA family ATPase n=1 Tax=Streptomyces sp. SAJ15 TaxID=2011095 RepID=UPI001185E57C|nr:AAA family ATPase [Streptomyces sp. SAJ15]TVL91938.1 hypothetical protein CD790_14765 [Streptomyces sp. SAJ15]
MSGTREAATKILAAHGIDPDTSDTSDASSEEEVSKLLDSIRDGAWLDGQHFPPLRYAVDGLLPEGAALLIGPPKAGKSWLVLDVLLAVASGGRALGALAVGAPRRVLYLAMEDGDRRMQDRCRTLLGDDPIPERFHYVTDVEPMLVRPLLDAFLDRYPDTVLVVVDTLGKVMPPARPGESAYSRDYRVMGHLKGVSDDHPGLSVTVIHHDRKAASEDFIDSVSGTHGLAGAADTIIVLARKRQSDDAVLKVTGRDVPEEEYALKMRDGVWTLDGSTLTDAAAQVRQRADAAELGEKSVAILDYVRQHHEGVRARDVAEEFGGDAHQYLKRLMESGRLIRLVRGLYAAADVPVSEPSEVSEPNEAPCIGCGGPLDPVHAAQGETTHPGCDPAARPRKEA